MLTISLATSGGMIHNTHLPVLGLCKLSCPAQFGGSIINRTLSCKAFHPVSPKFLPRSLSQSLRRLRQ